MQYFTIKEFKTVTIIFLCRSLELHVLASDQWFSDGVAYPRLPWLSSDLLPKLVRWATECKSSEFRSTLSLLPVEKYSVMYQTLKEKYKAMVKVKSAQRQRRINCVVDSISWFLILNTNAFFFRFGLRLRILRSLSMRTLPLLHISSWVQTWFWILFYNDQFESYFATCLFIFILTCMTTAKYTNTSILYIYAKVKLFFVTCCKVMNPRENQSECEKRLWLGTLIYVSHQRQVNGCEQQVIKSVHDQTVVLNLCHWTAGAVGGGASGERSDWKTVLCGPGLWKRPPGSHTGQWRGKQRAGWMLAVFDLH